MKNIEKDKSDLCEKNLAQLSLGRKILKVVGWMAWLTFCYFFASLLIFAIIWLVNFFAPDFLRNFGENILFNALLQAVIYGLILFFAIGLPYFFAKKNREVKKNDLKNNLGISRRPKIGEIFAVFWYLLVFYGFLVILSIVLQLILPSEIMEQEQITQFSENAKYAVWELILIGISLTIVPAFAEEILFRGFLFGKLRKFLRFWPTAFLVSFLFALWHLQINVGIMTFFLALFLCYLREKTGVIWSGIFLHFLVNFVAFSVRFLG